MPVDKYSWRVTTAPGAVPLLGHLPQLRKGLLNFLEGLPPFGDLVRIQFGPWKGYVACHPELVTEILRDDRTFDKGGTLFDKVRGVMGNGVVSCPHKDHRQQRRTLQPLFRRDRLVAYADMMTKQVHRQLDTWRDGDVIDANHEMHRLATRIISSTLFTTDPADPHSPTANAAAVVER